MQLYFQMQSCTMQSIHKRKGEHKMHYSKHCFCHKIIRYGSVVVFGFIMILLSHLTGLHEFMFPEGISVVLGVWAIERQPWRVNKAQLFFMMIIGSICAVCIVKYLPIPLIFQVLIAYNSGR